MEKLECLECLECPICLEELSIKSCDKTPCCRQYFHFKCLRRIKKDECPLCRVTIGYHHQIFGKILFKYCKDTCIDNLKWRILTLNFTSAFINRDELFDYVSEDIELKTDRFDIIFDGRFIRYDNKEIKKESTIYVLIRSACTKCRLSWIVD